ncbi:MULTISPECIES: glycoside hydrolase family 95 protein [unclassified Microbulbifer]|uniref:glycoside hydrolase family 95 protein n=1 Tax=unclassified Microbulbifer TaxID=2619833 RepID=UPI0027E4EEDC|nr:MULTISPECIES: glycoside hydrolase family 95 protein [unclassified Microbulbifer]
MQFLTRNFWGVVALLSATFATGVAADPGALKLWYEKPATRWEEALPLGNGRLGAMVYGGVGTETIQLNEDTFWAGGPHNNLNPAALEALPEIRRLIDAGDYAGASALGAKSITSQGAQGMPYQSAGVLRIDFPGQENFQDYHRELDLENAVARTRYRVGEVQYEREVFSSFVDQVVAVRLKASRAGALNFSLTLEHPDGMAVTANAADRSVLMEGRSRDHEGIEGQVKLADLAKIVQVDGRVRAKGDRLQVSGASEALILVSMATNFVNYRDLSADALARAEQAMQSAENRFGAGADAYAERLEAHSDFYRQYFDRVSLDLGGNDLDPNRPALEPTDKRIREFAKRHDPALVALYFQFGRYLLISSSQPGTQPANLQGIWNPHSEPPWDSKYTLNINAEMNYWPSEVTNLSELNEPLVQLVRDLSQTGRDSARLMYGARGWVAHHNTDIWRISGAVDWDWGPWPTSNAWLVQHLWQKYLYSGDEDFLRSVYPIFRSACEFFEDFLVRDARSGWLVVSPSMSPENAPWATGQKIAKGVTLDNQLLFDLFTHSVEAAKLLGEDKAAVKRWQAIIAQLPPMQIGQYHQLQEWMEDWDNPLDHHRHISHLYGLYPGNQISPLRTPELFNAARVTMEQRGDPSTGWSMNWKINLWARLLDGDRALKLIRAQISPARKDNAVAGDGGTYPNMFDAHPPFQIDGNFGFTAGIAEMLAQSHDGAVHLLPALPQAWPEGEVRGLVMRGGFVLDMRWDKGQVSYLKVLSRLGGNLRLRSHAPLPQAGDFAVKSARGSNPNPFYATPQVKAPLVHTQKRLPEISLDNSRLVDVATEAGREYVWTTAEN